MESAHVRLEKQHLCVNNGKSRLHRNKRLHVYQVYHVTLSYCHLFYPHLALALSLFTIWTTKSKLKQKNPIF